MSGKILNVGPKSAAWLRQVGIRTLADLQGVGAVGAFWKVKKAGFKPSLNLLYALGGAEKGCHWNALSASEKSDLVLQANALEDAAKGERQKGAPAYLVQFVSNEDQSEGAPLPGPHWSDASDEPPTTGADPD